MLKVMTIVGTRPEIIRLSRIIETFDAHFAHVLIHTGQNYDYELNQIFFSELGIRSPDLFLNAAGETATTAIGKVITRCCVSSKAIRSSSTSVSGRRRTDKLKLFVVARKQCAFLGARRSAKRALHVASCPEMFMYQPPKVVSRSGIAPV
ncbi:UDP-N-acetylglucosamine 2-epimerase [Nitrobacter sp. TKz-YC01]|uniref:UDP-N-acetylglucosamine 2-epimerase n=1 Tax=Nitrobacter sp. TKz-YC01 TaxID=3398703 RepID=UPI003A0FCD4B